MITKIVSISLGLGEAQGAWKQHPSNSVAQKLSVYLPNLTLISKFGFRKKLHFILAKCQK